VTYLSGLILRLVPITVCGTCFYASRVVLVFNHMMFFFRALHIFTVWEKLGPKVVMISKMVRFSFVMSCY